MAKLITRGLPLGLQAPKQKNFTAEAPKHSGPSGKPTGCRVEDVLGSRIIKVLLLKEVCVALHLFIFNICFDTGLKAMSTFECTQQVTGNKYADNIHARLIK